MRHVLTALCLLVWATLAQASEFAALARVDPQTTSLEATEARVTLHLGLRQGVPWRVRLEADPRRVVLELQSADWQGVEDALAPTGPVEAISARQGPDGWSQLALMLTDPMTIASAELRTEVDGQALIALDLEKASVEAFEAAVVPLLAREAVPAPVPAPLRRQTGTGPIVVALDPGHGGSDPGAEHSGIVEADLMLTFSKELGEMLLRDGRFEVVYTREEDVFVALDRRISIARAAGADVFLSLHADALAEGHASGATIYTLSPSAEDRAAVHLTERQDRRDILAGLDLTQVEDGIVHVLVDMARTDVSRRSDRLAEALVDRLRATSAKLHKRPRLHAGFSVLKAPDMPSALIELGFLSSKRDRERLVSPEWRAEFADAIRLALIDWATADASEAMRLRR